MGEVVKEEEEDDHLKPSLSKNQFFSPQSRTRKASGLHSSSKHKSSGSKFKPLVLVGPSGAGKSTLVKHLMAVAGDNFMFSISSTTRQPREGEISLQMLAQATSSSTKKFMAITTARTDAKSNIDVKGALTIAKEGKIECNYLFIKVPSIEELRVRLQARGTESEETLAVRLENAEKEQNTASEHKDIFNKFITNDKQENFLAEASTYLGVEVYPHLADALKPTH
ncbi:hypothetical protein FGO68_gene9236 [Halteria grandinella]|uniref:Guanylate kinase-like domain-containing protein n=1 Tax=Halteria grandinella TaxID=5974 RepID=A0A8J8NVU3_HALGN|nr:hypothetical protein FGO68_gene9236 [Halteria grandinella]